MRKRLFNKLGMTYIELLVALALLSLIIVSFTPMLMSSYENLYKAGERVETVYKSQEEMEEGLATRYSIRSSNISMSFIMNAQTVLQNLNVNGRKVVSGLQDRLETIFYGVRARIDIISGDTVYDDTLTHDIILQTTGLNYTKVTLGNYAGDINQLPENQIHIKAFIPDKITGASNGSTTDELAYGGKPASLSLISADSRQGRIAFTVGGADFTQSPIKFIVYYKNERGILKQLPAYLYVEPATMLMAGTTKSHDYYTSAGVELKDVSTDSTTQKTRYQLLIQGRTMRLDNSGLFATTDSPKSKGVTIKTITWVDQDENKKLNPYYVMAGSNGSVYRMYNYATLTNLQGAMGASNAVADTKDNALDLVTGVRVYQSFWSGEMSDHYSFQTMHKSSTYGNASDNVVDCSAPQSDSDWISGQAYIGTQYNKVDKTLRYSMMFNSYRTGYSYASQMSRKISYTLTEAGNKSFRIGGKKQDEGDFIGYHVPWEKSGDYKTYEGGVFSANTSDEEVIYLGGQGALAATNSHTEKHLGYIRINTYTNINPFVAEKDTTNYGTGERICDRFVTGGEFWSPPGYSEESLKGLDWKNRENYVNTQYGNNANITASAYLPGSGSNGQGQVIYFGSVPAYALLRQCSDIEKGETKVYNTKNVVASAATVYLVCGTQGNGTTIYRNAYSGADGANKTEGVDAQNLMRGHINSNNVSVKTDFNSFYTGGNDSVTYKIQDNNLEFTLGYCSRWRMAIGDVTFNGTTEETKSYEKYYVDSHPAAANGVRKPGAINGGGINNLYYNVWFPGEFYNLVAVDAKDGVTVAVGYTVSGSTFMEQSAYAGGYYGTALGSIYNDGVVAAYTSDSPSYTVSGKGEKTTIFNNLLYYKSTTFNESIHSRPSVRFTCVGINTETSQDAGGTSGTKRYYAYYGDNNGKVYRSLVATSTATFVGGSTEEDDTTNEKITLVNAIPDTHVSAPITSTANNGLQEITVDGKSMNEFFKEVVAIDAEEDIVIITGTPKQGAYNIVVVGTRADNNDWSWKKVRLGGYQDEIITSSFIVGGWYYVGVTDGGNGKWVGAVSLQVLKEAANNETIPPADTYSDVEKAFIYTAVGDVIYAIGGRETV